MTREMPVVVVPSYGRAGRVSTIDVFPEGVIVVPDKQEADYREMTLPEGWSIATVRDSEDGNIAKKRNAILRMFKGQDIVMVDDDYSYVGHIEGHQRRRLGHEDIRHLLWEGATLARDLKTPLWGLQLQADPKFAREWAPFNTIAVVLAPWHAWTAERPDNLTYDEDLWLKEDYDMSLRVLHRYHRILRFNQYHYMVDHFNEAGGVVGHRNMDEEVRQLHRLQRRWGSAVVKLELHSSVNPKINVPLVGL